MDLCLGLFNSLTFLDSEWLCATAIDGVLTESAALLSGVQSMSSEKAYYHLCKVKRNEPVVSSGIYPLSA